MYLTRIQFPLTRERLIRTIADAMVSQGFRDAGYEYICIDDCWPADERDAQGRLQPNPVRFPSGIKNLTDYVSLRGWNISLEALSFYIHIQELNIIFTIIFKEGNWHYIQYALNYYKCTTGDHETSVN